MTIPPTHAGKRPHDRRSLRSTNVVVLPVTADRLEDLRRFSAAHGRFRYCACMRWRMTAAEFRSSTPAARGAALEALVRDGRPVGLLAYADGEPVGWCSVAPRAGHAALERSRVLPRIDDAPVWSVTCFFVDARFRRRGVAGALLRAALAYARSSGAGIVEAYPVLPEARSYRFMGRLSTFLQAGFRDVTPPGLPRRILRRTFPVR